MCFTELCFRDQKTRFENQNKNGAKENKNQRKKLNFLLVHLEFYTCHAEIGGKKSVTWQRRQWNRNR